jgi:hypothetical protein
MRFSLAFLVVFVSLPVAAQLERVFEVPAGVETRWISFENVTGAKGEGGKAADGRKGSFFKPIKAGESLTLADIRGPGCIRRIWTTVRGVPEILRGMVIRIYWDDQAVPSVEAPIQDFFGVPFARQVKFESVFFSNPEGRSFNSFIPMPFQKRARVMIANESPKDCEAFAFDLNYTIGDKLRNPLSYFHTRYRRENPTTPKRDFEILPKISGRGRYLGANIGIRTIGEYQAPIWFGEGEIKVYLDGDERYPTLVGTGTEDLVGAAWGLGKFSHLYQGNLLSEKEDGLWALYRYHVPDPVYFHRDIRVTIQQIAGASLKQMRQLITSPNYPELTETRARFNPADYSDPRKWLNFEVPQDVCATAYWYQTLPSPAFGPLESYGDRMRDLKLPPKP